METDAALAGAAASGDSDAFERLYRRYRDGLYGFMLRLVADHHLAEDIVQECFVVAWRDLAKLREPASVRTWLFSVAYRTAMRHARRPSVVPLAEIPELADNDPAVRPEAVAEQREAQLLVWSAAIGLEPRQRAVIELAVRWELTSKEIGEVLGVGGGHAAVLVHRARAAMRTSIKAILVARQRDRCRGLERLLGGARHALTAGQRASVDRHMRRCPACKQLRAKVLAPAALALLFGKSNTKAAALNTGGLLVKAGGAVLAVAVAVGGYTFVAGSSQPQTAFVAKPSSSVPAAPSVAASPTPSAPAWLANGHAVPRGKAADTIEARLLALLNERRHALGLPVVARSTSMEQASHDCVQQNLDNDTFEHCGHEVLYWASYRASPEDIMAAWFNSPGHKQALTYASSRNAGAGVIVGSDGALMAALTIDY